MTYVYCGDINATFTDPLPPSLPPSLPPPILHSPGPCLYESGLIPKKLTYKEDAEALNYGIGITNIVPRTTRAASELTRYMYHH